MKQLLLIRHAKSSWKDRTLDDFDRPLNERGLRDAPLMAEKLAKSSFVPGLIISSPAIRAWQTANLIAAALPATPAQIRQEPDIYEANIQDLLTVIHRFPDELERVALVGHNPGMTALCYVLSLHDVGNMPTCGMTLIRFEVKSWRDVAPKTGEFVFFDYPKRGH